LAGLKVQKQRAEVNELFGALEEAYPVVKNLLETEQKVQATELLATMQEVLIQIGSKIEQVYGENDATADMISGLTQCCEMLWQCANAETKEEAVSLFDKVRKGIHDELDKEL